MKFLKLLLAVLLLPAILFLGAETLKAFALVALNFRETVYFLAGIILYLIIHRFVFNFSRLYVLAHEGAHIAAAKLCGFEVGSVKIGEDEGSVKISGNNFFVALAPYLFPVYTIAFSFLYFFTGLFIDIDFLNNWAVSVVGFLTCFHVTHTYLSIANATQSDLRDAGGRVFSVTLILASNIIILLVMFKLILSSSVDWGVVFGNVYTHTLWFYKALLNGFSAVWRAFSK